MRAVVCVLFALLATPAAAEPKLAPAEAAQRALARDTVRFCRDARYPLTHEELAWCAHLPAQGIDACPGLRAACAAGATAERTARTRGLFDSLPGARTAAYVALWVLLGGIGAWLLVALTRRSLAGASTEPATPDLPKAATPAVVAPRGKRQDAAAHLAAARAAFAAGEHDAALDRLHQALLHALAERANVELAPARTSDEYLRELARAAPPLLPTLAPLVRGIDAAQFGGRSAAQSFTAAVDEVAALIQGRGASLAAVVLSLALVFGAGCDPSARGPWEDSPSGFDAVIAFLDATGIPARERLAALPRLDDPDAADPAQIVLLPQAKLDEADWEALHRWLSRSEGTLIIARDAGPLPFWVPFSVELVARKLDATLVAAGRLTGGDGPATSTMRGRAPGATRVQDKHASAPPLVTRGGEPYALEREVEGGTVVALADARLFENASLAVRGNPELLAAILRDGGQGPTELVGEAAGLAPANPAVSLARGRLAPFAVQLGLFLLLLFAARGAAFGRLVDPRTAERRGFAEHVLALGQQYGRARALAHALSSYATWLIERLRQRVGSPQGPGVGDLAAALAARTGRPIGEVARVLLEARETAPTETARQREAVRVLAELSRELAGGAPLSRRR